jgi:hypothetical protein
MSEYSKKDVHLQTWKWALPRNSIYWHRDLELPSLQNCEK